MLQATHLRCQYTIKQDLEVILQFCRTQAKYLQETYIRHQHHDDGSWLDTAAVHESVSDTVCISTSQQAGVYQPPNDMPDRLKRTALTFTCQIRSTCTYIFMYHKFIPHIYTPTRKPKQESVMKTSIRTRNKLNKIVTSTLLLRRNSP
jgi:hypothetical protein